MSITRRVFPTYGKIGLHIFVLDMILIFESLSNKLSYLLFRCLFKPLFSSDAVDNIPIAEYGLAVCFCTGLCIGMRRGIFSHELFPTF